MNWFETLVGFSEESPAQVRDHLELQGEILRSRVNGNSYACGHLDTPSLAQLRLHPKPLSAPTTVREIIGDVQSLHTDPANAGATFQVASQFNLLEMVSPSYTPEHGVGIYENDRTQGPACAIACGAGTIFRNYYASANGQIDCLAPVGKALGNVGSTLWEMRNGYALPSESGLRNINAHLTSEPEADALRQLLRIGVQSNVQVTLNACAHKVTQTYCSALPVAYVRHPPQLWEPFARLVLEASYEACFLAALRNTAATGNRTLFLTLLGGGAFGNPTPWIADAIARALRLHSDSGLDVVLVSYRNLSGLLERLTARV